MEGLRGRPGGIIPLRMAGRLLQGALEAADNLAGAARHVAWYLSYCLDGSATRTGAGPPETPSSAEARSASSR
jgi:hypothetical protein